MAHEHRAHTMQGFSYRRQTPSESSLSGCRYLRCKAVMVIALGATLIIAFAATYSTATLIVGLCVVIIGAALFFMDFIARGLGKERVTRQVGRGVNRTWLRLRQERRERRHRNNSDRVVASENPSTIDQTPHDDGPPAYEMTLSPDELIRCPEPSDWTFLPSEPPPVYSPPTTDLDTVHSPASDLDEPPPDQSEPPNFNLGRQISIFTLSLPSYEEAILPHADRHETDLRTSESLPGQLADENTESPPSFDESVQSRVGATSGPGETNSVSYVNETITDLSDENDVSASDQVNQSSMG